MMTDSIRPPPETSDTSFRVPSRARRTSLTSSGHGEAALDEALAKAARQIRHLRRIDDAARVNPLEQLPRAERGLAEIRHDGLPLLREPRDRMLWNAGRHDFLSLGYDPVSVELFQRHAARGLALRVHRPIPARLSFTRDSTWSNRRRKRSVVPRRASSASTPRCRAKFTRENRTSPSSSEIRARSPPSTALIELTQLFGDLVAGTARVGPIETDASDLLTELVRAKERGQGSRNAVEERAITLLEPLDGVPVVEHLLGAAHAFVAEDVGVAPDELFADGAHDVVRAERTVAPSELCQKYDLEREITELVHELARLTAVDRVDHFARLLEDVLPERTGVLFAIPRAAVGRE